MVGFFEAGVILQTCITSYFFLLTKTVKFASVKGSARKSETFETYAK